MSLAIFDLDNTLIAGDSDHAWGEFLIDIGIVDGRLHRKKNDAFYGDYCRGELDIEAYVDFALGPVKTMPREQRDSLQREFMASRIEPLILPKAEALLEHHRQQGHTLLIITATNSFVTAPIAKKLGVEYLLATEPEIIDDQFSGRILGVPCFQDGKVTRLNEWLALRNESMGNSFFYSDSFNDIPLLQIVNFPYAVDPDETLKTHAEKHQWPIITLR